MSNAGACLFVYYKLPAVESAVWLPRVKAFFNAVTAGWPGVTVELMRRLQANQDGQLTWMEVYRHPQGIDGGFAEAVDEIARAHQLPFARASEIFIPLNGQ